jgi:hypothetical protein
MEQVLSLLVLADGHAGSDRSVVAGETVFKATSQLRVVVVRPASGYLVDSFAVDGTGAGFSAEAAERQALEQAVASAASRLAQYR